MTTRTAAEPVTRTLEVRLVPEAEGGFSAYVPTLPGVHSQGDTEAEAEAMIAEAAAAALETYTAEGMPIPWNGFTRPPAPGEIVRWVVVDA
jgi:predicted RNase H-like HicB family nuclease